MGPQAQVDCTGSQEKSLNPQWRLREALAGLLPAKSPRPLSFRPQVAGSRGVPDPPRILALSRSEEAPGSLGRKPRARVLDVPNKGRAPRAPLPSEGESSGAAVAGTAGDVAAAAVAAAGAGWLVAAAVESASGSGSGSGSRPGVLLRGPGGESCRIGLRPGTARDFFPITSPSASSEPQQSGGAGARSPGA